MDTQPTAPTAGLRVTRSLVIPHSELRWQFSASGGPGGQHANTANTRAEVTFDIGASPSLSEIHRERLSARFGPLLRVVASDTRSQGRNRIMAEERLRTQLTNALRVEKARRPTKPSKAATGRRLNEKARNSARKADRRRPTSTD